MKLFRTIVGLPLVFVSALSAGCNVVSFPSLGKDVAERDKTETASLKHSQRVGQFVFLSDFEIQRNLPLFRELGQLGEQVYKELQLPPSQALVQVYLFETRERYERFMQLKYPDLPKRRAFFVAQPRRLGGVEDLYVYTYWGDRIQQDLRHELTHALLHCVLKDVPLWLDEGLAEFFEVPPGWNGVNLQHVLQLNRDGQGKLGLERLEQLTDVQQMTPAEYREAWAWVHFLLRSDQRARQALITYLHDLRGARTGPLRPRLEAIYPSPEAALERHVAQLAKSKGGR
ncbi:MAG: DUF1570 domain-containing protein [Gemmataceae bacterium]|nr:DUF1570 domain-containing protein [Gemmataceae bacterium]